MREIVEIELKQSEKVKDEVNQNQSQNDIEDIAEEEEEEPVVNEEPQKKLNGGVINETEINIINKEKVYLESKEEITSPVKTDIIEYSVDDKDTKVCDNFFLCHSLTDSFSGY